MIDNKGGGNGIPAAETVARARPDGLTLFATSAMTQAVNPAIYDKLPYDPVEDFSAITRMGTSPFVLLVDRNSPINTAAELTAKLKAEPGKHNYGAGALPARVASELYKMAAGVDAVYVGYKSNPQAIPDVQGSPPGRASMRPKALPARSCSRSMPISPGSRPCRRSSSDLPRSAACPSS